GKHTDIDQSIQVEAVYGRRINSFLSAKVGLIYTSIGNPLHYNIPDRPNLGIPETKGAGFTDEAMGDVDSTMTLRSVTTLGISLGMEYEKVLYKKWSLQTGLSFVPSLLFKTSHHYEGGYHGKLYTNSMGAAGFRNLGLATLTHASIAYKPIKRAQITAGVQSSYYLISLHKNERLAPLTLGATLGLKWMF
ncbi:MAG TPA: hypothetical protein VL947_04420, partial [Cytophagales bacterium]|nr:hypothetical protein [Cytophagales bacterium]